MSTPSKRTHASAARVFSPVASRMKSYRVVNIPLIILAVTTGSSQSDFRDCNNCGGVFTARQSVLVSPNYPESYPSMTCCHYVIRSPYRCPSDFHVQFLDFSLEPSEDCRNDFLAISGDTDVDARNYTGNILCGHVAGIRTYRSQDGVLSVRFVTNHAVEDRGFRLLITRLSCEETTTSRRGENISDPAVTLPTLELRPPFQGKQTAPAPTTDVADLTRPANNHREDVFRSEQYQPQPPAPGYLPNNPLHPSYPQLPSPLTPPNNGYLPPGRPCPQPPAIQGNNYYPQQQLPESGSCCAGSFRQQRFHLASPGFPTTTADAGPPRDCFYYIEKSAPSVCRLRVVFRFFALGSADINSGQCLSDFIEIDGERMCGCRTGFVFASEWGLGAKVIRLKTNGRLSGTASNGFLLDVIQEECGAARRSRQVGGDIDPGRLIPHAVVETNSTSRTRFFLRESGVETLAYGLPPPDGVNSKLFFAQSNPCEFGFADLLRISFDPLWITRPGC